MIQHVVIWTLTVARRLRCCPMLAVMVMCNAVFLAYTAAIAPVQICLWNYDDPCNSIATLYFDAFVDIFFLVPA
jgi:hypothetical protein